MTSLLSLIQTFANRFFRSTVVKIFGGLFGGIVFTLFAMRLWSSLGSKYVYMILGGLLVAVLILILIYLLWKNLQVSRAKKMEAALQETVKQKKQRQQQLKTAISSIKDKWQTAMATLKSAKINIYDIPWVLLIGEPQSGKTTTLKRSGLDFPIGRDALSGAGGTVNCDWWFTNDAVVIDTAGRFTMPVDSAPDKEEWHAFLKLLAKYRPKCPVNNIIVTIPVTSFLEDDADKLEEKASKIREKLLEITQVLRIQFPVYIMVSKSDLINGFTEFCASLSSIENTQILGWNSGVAPTPFNPDSFHHHFENLKHRFYKWSLRRLRDLPVGKEADKIFSFHSSFNGIQEPLRTYLSTIFKEDKFNTSLLFRGCFFSSGLQEGQAIVKAIEKGSVSDAAQFSGSFSKSRPYFIYNFYKKVFLENGLVARVGNITQKERRLKRTITIIACLFSLASAWYLWTGYNLLTQVLKPTQARVGNVMRLMMADDSPRPAYRAGKIVQMAGIVEKDRERISSQGVSYRFLRGKDNTLVKDMKNIEDAVLLRGLFRPVINIAAGSINKHPVLYDDKVQLVDNLALGLGILVNSPPELYSLEPDVLMVKQTDPWMDIEPEVVMQLADEFPKGDVLKLSHRYPDKARLFTRQQISGLNRFWKTYPEQTWVRLKQNLLDIIRRYRSMVAAQGMGLEQEKAFRFNANAFIAAAAGFNESSKKKHAVFPGELFLDCTNDYGRLSTLLEKGHNQEEAVYFQSTIKRHTDVCGQVNKKILADLSNYPELTASLITADGNIHPEFETILDIVESTLNFSPLFMDTHRQMVSENPERILGFLEAWDGEWHTKKSEMEKELSGRIESLTAPGWQKEQLSNAIGYYMSDEIWEADIRAALTAIESVLKDNALTERTLSPGMVLPNAARIKWLEEKFELFAGINSWLIQKYPSRPDINRGTGQITRAMTEIYANYLTFWNNTLDSYDPSRGIVKTNSWKRYRKRVLQKRGLFLDPGSWPFNLFLENVTLAGLDNLKTILGEDRDEAAVRLEKNISRTAYVYSMASGNLGALGSAQDRFFQCVDALADTPSEALTALNEGLMEDFRALSSFRHRVDSGLGAGEILAGRLERIQRHGLTILKKGFASGFSQDQKALIDKWYDSFKQLYPFSPKGRMVHWSKLDVDLISKHFSTVPSQNFYDFCFDDVLGLAMLEKKYDLQNAIKKQPKSRKYNFVKAGLAWKDFIYDRDRMPKIHDLKISLSDNNYIVSKKFTVLKIRGLHKDGGSRALLLRFSGQRYKTTKGVWHIDQDVPIQFSVENEETRIASRVVLSDNNFTFPAYLVNNGKKKSPSNAREWEIALEFFDKESTGDTFRINLVIEWDESLPDDIPWTAY